MTTADVLYEVRMERMRQDEKWGEQNHPDGTGGPATQRLAEMARLACDAAASDGSVKWMHILREEFCEAMAEGDQGRLREELKQVAAVAVAWVECIDRRAAAQARAVLGGENNG